MLQIRNTQMLQMLETNDALLRTAITKRVREQYAELVNGLPNDLLDEMIENGIQSARGYGLTQAENITEFVLIMFEVGPEFHRHPRIRPILSDPTIAAEEKLKVMFDRTPDQYWDEIVSVLYRQTWFPERRQPNED